MSWVWRPIVFPHWFGFSLYSRCKTPPNDSSPSEYMYIPTLGPLMHGLRVSNERIQIALYEEHRKFRMSILDYNFCFGLVSHIGLIFFMLKLNIYVNWADPFKLAIRPGLCVERAVWGWAVIRGD